MFKFLTYFTLLIINIRGIASKGAEFQHYLSNLKEAPQIICFQETWLNNDNEFHFEDYSLVNRNRQEKHGVGGGGGAQFIIHKNANFGDVSISNKHE